MRYNQFLWNHVFNYDDYVKDFVKCRFGSILPKRKFEGRNLYYHYVFPQNYSNFMMQIEYFQKSGFLELGSGSPTQFSLTFDDTYRINRNVFLFLHKQNIPVTLFVSPRAVTEQLDIYSNSKLPQFTIDDLKHLRDIGVTIQNHTYSHSIFSSDSELVIDFQRAQSWFEQNLSISPNYAALPRGDMPSEPEFFKQSLKSIGIECVFTTSRTASLDKYFEGRHHIMPHWPKKTLEYFFNV